MCRHVTTVLHPGLYRLCYVSLTTGNVLDMYKSIAWELGLPTERSRATASGSPRIRIANTVWETGFGLENLFSRLTATDGNPDGDASCYRIPGAAPNRSPCREGLGRFPSKVAAARTSLLYSDITLEVRMHTTNLRKVGGSVMLAVPPALLDLLKLGAGARVDIGVENGRLIVAPRTRPNYSLKELLAQCDETAPPDDGDRAWLDASPVGNELL